MRDYFSLAFNNLKRRRLRSWLTMIGIFIGVASVVALISLGQGLQNTIKEQFEILGTDKLIVMPGGKGGMPLASAEKLTSKDLEIIRQTKGVDVATEMIYSIVLIESRGEAKQTMIIGLSTDESSSVLKDMEGFEAEKGRDLREKDKEKIIIGHLISKDNGFFEKGVGLRDKILIRGKEFKVVGIMSKIGNPQDDTQVYIPIEIARELFEKEDEIDSIYVKVKSNFQPIDVAEEIKKELRDFRDEEKGQETFSVQTFEQLLETFSNIFGIVQVVLVGIAGISLFVGGIGIMNTMYTSVLERTKEIGTMKAMGAKDSDILYIFLFESGLLGLVGGGIGILIGIGLGKGAEYLAGMAFRTDMLKAVFPWYLITGTLLFSFLIGMISGVLPALQAAKLKPADALRYE